MKETPPVLTAGPAAWIREGGRKRSRLLGTRRGGPWAGGSPGPGGPSPRAGPRSRAQPPRAVPAPGPCASEPLPPGARGGAGQPGPRPALGAGRRTVARTWSRAAEAPGAAEPGLHAPPVCTPSPVWSLQPQQSSQTGMPDPTSPHLQTPRSQGGPRRSRGAPEAEAGVGGLPSRFGGDRRVERNDGNVFNVRPQHQDSPTRPAGLRIAGCWGLGPGLSGEETPQTSANAQQPPGPAFLGGGLAGLPGVAQEATAPEKPTPGLQGAWEPWGGVGWGRRWLCQQMPSSRAGVGGGGGVEGREPEMWPPRPPGTPGPPTPRPGAASLEA